MDHSLVSMKNSPQAFSSSRRTMTAVAFASLALIGNESNNSCICGTKKHVENSSITLWLLDKTSKAKQLWKTKNSKQAESFSHFTYK